MHPVDDEHAFTPGETVVYREVWRGEPWSTYAVTVVADGDGRTLLYRPIGAPGMIPVNERGPYGRAETGHWHEPRTWQGRHALLIHEWGDPYSIWCMWDTDWQHTSWYVNLEEPWRRAPGAIETMDHELDIVVERDHSWAWKDEDKVALLVERGAHTEAEAAGFRTAGEQVVRDRIEPWATPFDEGWESWRPDPTWRVPALPPTWRDRGHA